MKIVVGLGNPGSRYAATRHNAGFRVLDRLAAKWGFDLSKEKFHAWFGDGIIEEEKVVLLKPTTFMNRSGQAVAAAVKFYGIEIGDLMVISDDMNLDCGRLRLRRGGSSGGHNGLQDVTDCLGSDQFPRLRIGVDPPVGDPVSYVLTTFSSDQEAVIGRAVERAAEAVEHWVREGIESTMNRYNASEET